ncbi:MAG: hypothetical protein PW843_01300 [Azospirillaceae bacterium]|nr:hypothetical protein [Azospirillaceae bacterium]
MQIDSQAANATAATLLQARTQFQVGALKQTTDAEASVATALLTGQSPAPSDGRGQMVDLSV